MHFNKKNIEEEIRLTRSRGGKLSTKSALFLLKILLAAMILAAAMTGFCVFGAVRGVIDGTPVLTDIDVSPQGLSTTIYDSDGNVIQTLIGSGANRSLVSYSQLPQDLINAFVAIEDSRFWTHEGVDVKGIVRAGTIGLTSGRFSEGASTITQQLIKNNVLNGGEEKTTGARFVRKIQEQTLALELEKSMAKMTILENYLNTINLGSGCLGVEKAAERYFDKSVEDLTLSECAVIAGITQNPYGYNPIRFPSKNAERREKVLNDMQEQGYISEEQKQEALADDVYTRIAAADRNRDDTETVYSYFVDRLINDVLRDLQQAGYTSDQAYAMLYSGGLHIYTTQDPSIQAVVDEEIADEENYEGIDLKYSFTYYLRLSHPDGTYTSYDTSHIRQFAERTYLEYDDTEDIEELVEDFKASVINVGDTVISESTVITPQPQISMTVMDQSTGQVKALAGGRGTKTASLSLNRATNTFRQPGSTFKVLSAFAPAIDAKGLTLASVYYDEPYVTEVNGTEWKPKNWYSKSKYAGFANIHQGITYSMNIVAVRCLVEDVSPKLAFRYLEDFGINTLIPETDENAVSGLHDVRATLALGGITQGVTNMQLTGAYAAIANGGQYVEPILYTRILDNNGKVIIDNTPDTRRVLEKSTAFLLTTAMSSSLEDTRLNDLFSSSSPEAKPERLPAAGKSGTTTSYNDLWFVGYTPYYTIGIWSGFDDNAKFEDTDDRDFHKVIWKKVMDRITEDLPHRDFVQPKGIVTATICTKSGLLATDACSCDGRDSIIETEYFLEGTEPTTSCDKHRLYEVCRQSHMLPGPYCKNISYRSYVKLPSETNGSTQDSQYHRKPSEICTQCKPAADTGTGGNQVPQSGSLTQGNTTIITGIGD